MKRRIVLMVLGVFLSSQLMAQNWDVNTVEKVNAWNMHGVSRGLSHSGVVLPVAVPTAMGIYALVKKDQPLLKDAIYIGTSVIEALGITYGMKYTFDRERPYVKYIRIIRKIVRLFHRDIRLQPFLWLPH